MKARPNLTECSHRKCDLGLLRLAEGPEAAKERIAKVVPFYKDLIAKTKIPQIQ